MAGTDDAVAAGDDALYVLTAVLLTPAKFPSVLGDDYPEACATLGLAPLADGYGLVLGQDGAGARWTVVIDDVSLVAVAIASWDCGMEYELSPDEGAVVSALPGWPLALSVSAPGVPDPHDPEHDPEIMDGPPLTPPNTETWGPAQRRLGADEIALQWASWREQIDDSAFLTDDADDVGGASAAEGADGTNADSTPAPTTTDSGDAATATASGSDTEAQSTRAPHAGIRRVLAEVRAYVDSPPPWAVSGRRSRPAMPGRFGPTVPAGRWWPGRTTSRSCSWTTSPVRCCPWGGAPSCPASWKRSTRWPCDPPDPSRSGPRSPLRAGRPILPTPHTAPLPHVAPAHGPATGPARTMAPLVTLAGPSSSRRLTMRVSGTVPLFATALLALAASGPVPAGAAVESGGGGRTARARRGCTSRVPPFNRAPAWTT